MTDGAGDLVGRLVEAGVRAIEGHAEELTRLDQAIGDGDHGINLSRGFAAVAAERQALAALPLGRALHKAGTILVMKVGGASGPLFGSLLMAMGEAAGEGPVTLAGAAVMLRRGVEAVMRRGRSTVGEKTMLDVVGPVAAALEEAVAAGLSPGEAAARLRLAADLGLQSTRPLRATKGRAAFLGERSIGHLDPGARSSQLLVEAVVSVVEGA
jgi:dihydroxyacetone kinase-like protein